MADKTEVQSRVRIACVQSKIMLSVLFSTMESRLGRWSMHVTLVVSSCTISKINIIRNVNLDFR